MISKLKQKRLLYQISYMPIILKILSNKDMFQKPRKTICIDLILTNSSTSFQKTITFEMELSDFHELVVRVLKLYFPKQKPKFVLYQAYKPFCNYSFRTELECELSKLDICDTGYDRFLHFLQKSWINTRPWKKNTED